MQSHINIIGWHTQTQWCHMTQYLPVVCKENGLHNFVNQHRLTKLRRAEHTINIWRKGMYCTKTAVCSIMKHLFEFADYCVGFICDQATVWHAFEHPANQYHKCKKLCNKLGVSDQKLIGDFKHSDTYHNMTFLCCLGCTNGYLNLIHIQQDIFIVYMFQINRIYGIK